LDTRPHELLRVCVQKCWGHFRYQVTAGREPFYGMRRAHDTLHVSALVNQRSMHFAGISISESGIGYTAQQRMPSCMSVPRGRGVRGAVGLEIQPRAYRATRKKRCSVLHGLAFSTRGSNLIPQSHDLNCLSLASLHEPALLVHLPRRASFRSAICQRGCHFCRGGPWPKTLGTPMKPCNLWP
jgi:hypothetical protein